MYLGIVTVVNNETVYLDIESRDCKGEHVENEMKICGCKECCSPIKIIGILQRMNPTQLSHEKKKFRVQDPGYRIWRLPAMAPATRPHRVP